MATSKSTEKPKPVGITLAPSFEDENGDTWVLMQLTPYGENLLLYGEEE